MLFILNFFLLYMKGRLDGPFSIVCYLYGIFFTATSLSATAKNVLAIPVTTHIQEQRTTNIQLYPVHKRHQALRGGWGQIYIDLC